MATLEKIKTMRDADIQQWLRQIDAEDLKVAIGKMDEETQACIFRNISMLAIGVLKENIKKKDALLEPVVHASFQKLERALDAV